MAGFSLGRWRFLLFYVSQLNEFQTVYWSLLLTWEEDTGLPGVCNIAAQACLGRVVQPQWGAGSVDLRVISCTGNIFWLMPV